MNVLSVKILNNVDAVNMQ